MHQGAFSLHKKIMKSLFGDDEIKISDPEQILEPHCDITAKDTGLQYRGLVSGKIYRVVKSWEVDVPRE